MALYEGVYLYFLDALMFPILNPLSVPNGNVGTKGTANPQPVEDELEELLEDEDGEELELLELKLLLLEELLLDELELNDDKELLLEEDELELNDDKLDLELKDDKELLEANEPLLPIDKALADNTEPLTGVDVVVTIPLLKSIVGFLAL
jgi:hypothetical protein